MSHQASGNTDKQFPVLRRTAALQEHGLPSLLLAKEYKIFVGPERYSIKDCPEYDFAFRTLSLGDDLDHGSHEEVRMWGWHTFDGRIVQPSVRTQEAVS